MDGVISHKIINYINFNTKMLMLLNATNQPNTTVELSYICPRGLSGQPAMTLIKSLKYKNRLRLRCIHNFKSDLIISMDLLCISGTEPSSVILSL